MFPKMRCSRVNCLHIFIDFILDDPTLRNDDESAEKLTHSLQMLEILCPVVHEELLTHVCTLVFDPYEL